MKIPRDDGLLSEPTTEVNGNNPWCKRVGQKEKKRQEQTDRQIISHTKRQTGRQREERDCDKEKGRSNGMSAENIKKC